MAGYAKPDALVETDWLEEHVQDPGTRVIEVDEDTEAYEKGHIEGAVGWNWTTDLHTEVGRDYVDVAVLRGTYQGGGQAELEVQVSCEALGSDPAAQLRGSGDEPIARLVAITRHRGISGSDLQLLAGPAAEANGQPQPVLAEAHDAPDAPGRLRAVHDVVADLDLPVALGGHTAISPDGAARSPV